MMIKKTHPKKPSAQIDLPFDDKPENKKETPRPEKGTGVLREPMMTTAQPEGLDKYAKILNNEEDGEKGDKDEDPRAQAAREWQGYWAGRGGRRRA